MSAHTHLVVEAHGTAVTLYIHGPLGRGDVSPLLLSLFALPQRVSALRLELRALAAFDGDAIEAILDVIDAWRTSRCGVARIVPLMPVRPSPLPTGALPVLHRPVTRRA